MLQIKGYQSSGVAPYETSKHTLGTSPLFSACFRVKLLLILKILHDLSILQYHYCQGLGYLGLCRIFSIHRRAMKEPEMTFSTITTRLPCIHGGSVFHESCIYNTTWGFPKIRGTILGVPIIRTIVFWGILGSHYFGKPPCNNNFECGLRMSCRQIVFIVRCHHCLVRSVLHFSSRTTYSNRSPNSHPCLLQVHS